MFDISFLEISVICVITLIVVGPEKLPGLVRDVSRVIRKLRRIVTQTRYELEREFDFEEERKKLEDMTKNNAGLDDAMDELDDLMKIAPDRDGDAENKPAGDKKTVPDSKQDDASQTNSKQQAIDP